MTTLEEIQEANKRFLAGNPRSLEPSGPRFVVLACIDDRLTGMLESALGLPRRRATLVRIAGNRISESCKEAIRSIAAAVYIGEAEELFVVGHTECRLSQFSARDVMESFRARGIPRSAFGDEDLRSWFGAFHDVKENVLDSIHWLRNSPLLHAGIKVHGLLLDSEGGNLEVLHDGDQGSDLPTIATTTPHDQDEAVEAAETSTVDAPPAGRTSSQPPPLPRQRPVNIPDTKAALSTSGEKGSGGSDTISLVEAVRVLRDVFNQERADPHLRQSVQNLRLRAKGEKNPFVIVREIEKTLTRYKEKYPKLPLALSHLKEIVSSKRAGGDALELLRTMLQ